jgi:hypothetical protein
MKKVLTLLAIAFINVSAFAQTNTEYAETLKKMFKVSGSEETYKSAIKQIFTMYKQQYTDVSAEVWSEFEKEFYAASIDELTEMLAPVYQKHLTQQDLEKLIAFYETPIGKKYAESTPKLMEESMQIGQQWGMKIAQKFQQKMEEKGY